MLHVNHSTPVALLLPLLAAIVVPGSALAASLEPLPGNQQVIAGGAYPDMMTQPVVWKDWVGFGAFAASYSGRSAVKGYAWDASIGQFLELDPNAITNYYLDIHENYIVGVSYFDSSRRSTVTVRDLITGANGAIWAPLEGEYVFQYPRVTTSKSAPRFAYMERALGSMGPHWNVTYYVPKTEKPVPCYSPGMEDYDQIEPTIWGDAIAWVEDDPRSEITERYSVWMGTKTDPGCDAVRIGLGRHPELHRDWMVFEGAEGRTIQVFDIAKGTEDHLEDMPLCERFRMPKPAELLGGDGKPHRVVFFLGEGCGAEKTGILRMLFARDLETKRTFYVEKTNLVQEIRPDFDPAIYDVDDFGNVVFTQLSDQIVSVGAHRSRVPTMYEIVRFEIETSKL